VSSGERFQNFKELCTFMVRGQAVLLGMLDCVLKCTTVLQNVGKNKAATTALSVCQPQ
jgi:hypothetical protein